MVPRVALALMLAVPALAQEYNIGSVRLSGIGLGI